MKIDEVVREKISRNTFPTQSVPLVDWLKAPVRVSKRVKITLAYIIARSVWQYYNSLWMATPWTLENIYLIKELVIGSSHIRPHPYFITKLKKHGDQIQDFCIADDLLHMYPNVLALAIILLEIAIQQPFMPEGLDCQWSATMINDCYEWAWTTANQSQLGHIVGETYERVVSNCLDPDLFQDGPLDTATPELNLRIRLSIIYDKIVKPLRELYHAYRDDWEIEGDAAGPTGPTQSVHGATQFASSAPIDRNRFTVAVFCALPLEADAVRELLEEISDNGRNYGKAPADNNEYTLGTIMSHHVVLVHMPGMGKGAASQAASNLRSTFPGIELALVVGVCGGVPSPTPEREELILGDVVISEGIVQYDLGSQYPDFFMSKPGAQAMALPPPRIRAKLAKLKGIRSRERLETRLLHHLQTIQGKLGILTAGYPGVEKDRLYQTRHRHKHHHGGGAAHCAVCSAYRVYTDPVCKETLTMTCQQLGCYNKNFLVPRTRLQTPSSNTAAAPPPRPKIHFGLVGSGDTVMKSGEHRDATAATHNLVAFEMEAAGIWDCLPCLVIKGVCDYADSHKNKHFQNYAATTSAACVSAFLEEWPGSPF
jgi:nucleoside phosphorylase